MIRGCEPQFATRRWPAIGMAAALLPVAKRMNANAHRLFRCPAERSLAQNSLQPARTSSSFARVSLPTRSTKSSLSMETTSDALATESCGKCVALDDRSTFPGTFAQRVFVVSGTQTTVAIRLRLKESPWMTTTGRRKPGPDPTGSGRSVHHTSPCEITTQSSPTPGAKRHPQIRPPDPRFHRRPGWIASVTSSGA